MSGILVPSGNSVNVARTYNKGVPYLDGFAQTKGRMAGNLDHKYLLVDTKLYENVSSGYPGWAKEVIGKAAKGQRLQKGQDVKDAETGWTVAASEVQKATGGDPYKPGSVLFIDPVNFEGKNGKMLLIDHAGTIDVNATFDAGSGVIVIPKSIVVVENAQETGVAGKVDEKTGLIVKVKNADALKENEKGWNYYLDAESVRPLARGDYGLCYGRRYVGGDDRPSAGLGVFELVAQLAPEQLKQLASTAQTEIAGLPEKIRSALPASVQQLIDAIGKQ